MKPIGSFVYALEGIMGAMLGLMQTISFKFSIASTIGIVLMLFSFGAFLYIAKSKSITHEQRKHLLTTYCIGIILGLCLILSGSLHAVY